MGASWRDFSLLLDFFGYFINLLTDAMGDNFDAMKKKAADEATSNVVPASLSWPIEGYDLFIPLLLAYMFAIFNLFIMHMQ